MSEDSLRDGLRVHRDGRIATVTIERPPVNSLSFSAYDAVRRVFDELSAEASISVVVLTGEGRRAFCAGHDVNEFVSLTPESSHSQLPRVQAAFDAVQGCAVPVIAAVNGPAVGAGLALASLSDVRWPRPPRSSRCRRSMSASSVARHTSCDWYRRAQQGCWR